ncbi:peroxiredoxin [Gynuella sp.]|uniref:peroxiredoxin n=1 Tax=Gynuella sp. TaxID=2969146 RepID=UPI003D13D233
MENLEDLPINLPVPEDDGACDHLLNLSLPSFQLLATSGELVDLSSLDSVVIYIYPKTGRPDKSQPTGWEQIPGARGCTPQSCSFRNHYNELKALGTEVFGLSVQSQQYQIEAKTRLHLPFELVSDENLQLIRALNLPTFRVEGVILAKRVTLIANRGLITKVFYPVFPPDRNADQVIDYLQTKMA